MYSKPLRDSLFTLHRYIGLVVGLLLIVVGLTGSLLVFQEEIDHFLLSLQIGHIVPQENRISLESALDAVKAAYASRPDFTLSSINPSLQPDAPYTVGLTSSAEEYIDVYVNPYTGAVLGSRQWEHTFIGVIYQLHYALLAGDVGMKIVGVVALLLLILSITGLLLWPGWRKLISGFKIKWNAHPKRVNFDLHKVAGIVAVVFLALTAFTGFCWNFAEFTYPIIYTATLTPQLEDPVSQPIAGKAPLGLNEILQKADVALPGAVTTFIVLPLPDEPEGTFMIRKKFSQETIANGQSRVYLDQYSGEVLQLQNSLSPSRGDQVLNSFFPLHYGTFWGLPSRMLYVFVGLAPLISFITGFVMWKYRYRPQNNHLTGVREPAEQRRA